MARAKHKQQLTPTKIEKPKAGNKASVFSIAYMLLLAVWPFVALTSIPDQLLLPRLATICIFTSIMGILIFVKRKEFAFSIPWASPLMVCFIMWLVILSISYFWASNKAEAFQTIVSIWSITVFAIITLLLYINNKLTFDTILNAITMMFVGFVFFGLMDTLETGFGSGELGLNGITGHMGNKNELSAILVFCFPFALLKIYRSKTVMMYLLILLVVIALFIIALLRSRGAWLALGFSATVILIIALLRSGKRFVKPVILGVTFSVAIFVSVYFAVHRVEGNPVTSTETLDTRWQLWSTTTKMIHDRPLLGVGAGNWKIQNPSYLLPKLDATKPYYKSLILGEANFQQPHNDFLWVISENGVIAGIFYLGIFISLLYYSIRLIQASDGETLAENIVLLAYLLSYIVIANFAFPMERPTHQLLLFVIAGMVGARYYALAEKKAAMGSAVIVSIPMVAVSLVCLWGISQLISSETNMKDGLEARAKGNYKKALGYYEKALTPYFNIDHASTPVKWYMGECYAVANDYKSALAAYQEASLAHPYKIHNIANIGVAYYQLQQPDSAIAYFKKAVALSPAFTEADINLAIYYLQQKDMDTALKYFLQSYPDELDKRYLYFNKELLGTYIEQLEDNEPNEQKRAKLAAIHNDTRRLLDIQQQCFTTKSALKQVIYSSL